MIIYKIEAILRVCFMKYQQSDLNNLWNLIKDSKCNFWGTIAGLQEVPFEQPPHIFKEIYLAQKEEYYKGNIALVIPDVKEVIHLLTGSFIQFHHLSCGANQREYDDNSALCIHYTTYPHEMYFDLPIGERIIHQIAIPGITHVPSEETISMWKEREKESGPLENVNTKGPSPLDEKIETATSTISSQNQKSFH